MEKVTQTVPTPSPSVIDWEIDRLDLWWGKAIIHVDVKSNTGIYRSKEYIGDDARNKMIALNKANLSTKSLHKRVMEFLIVDGVIEGIITGTPD